MIFKYIKERLSPKGLIQYELAKGIFWGTLALIAAFLFTFHLTGNPYHEYQLITNGITTQGFITETFEDAGSGPEGGTHFYYDYKYNFRTDNGKIIQSDGEGVGRLRDEFIDLIDPFPIQVVYLKNKPEINSLKDSLCDSVWELLWRKVGIGTIMLVMLSSIGFILIRNALKEYSSDCKKLPSYIDYLNKKENRSG